MSQPQTKNIILSKYGAGVLNQNPPSNFTAIEMFVLCTYIVNIIMIVERFVGNYPKFWQKSQVTRV